MPSSIQKRAVLGIDYDSVIGSDKTIDRYVCRHCGLQTASKYSYLIPNEPKRNALNRLRGEIMNHAKEKHMP